MKRFVSIFMVLLIVMSFAAISVSALESAQTVVSVKKGDEVVYTLNLTTPEKVVGCDFSVYYDSAALQVQSVADFTGNYDSDEHQAVINPNIKDEVIGNWSILSGVRFNDNNPVVSVKFKAMKDTDTHVSYYVRYLYPESMEQFTEYKFTCDVQVNKKAVIDDEAPELNVEEQQPHGQFVNSVTGDGKDANVNTSTHVPNNNNNNNSNNGNNSDGVNGGEVNENDVNNSDNAAQTNDNKTSDKKSDKDTSDKKDSKNDSKKDADDKKADTKESVVSEDETVVVKETVVSTANQTEKSNSIFASAWFWIIVGIIVVGGGVAAVLAVKIKKNSKA